VELHTVQPRGSSHAHDSCGSGKAAAPRVLSLADWGPTAADTGAVASLAWAHDEAALAVGLASRGLVVWAPSGCRLMCTIRQGAGGETAAALSAGFVPSPSSSSSREHTAEALHGGVEHVCWGLGGFSLLAVERGERKVDGAQGFSQRAADATAPRLLEFSMARPVVARRVAQGVCGVHLLYAADRLLAVHAPGCVRVCPNHFPVVPSPSVRSPASLLPGLLPDSATHVACVCIHVFPPPVEGTLWSVEEAMYSARGCTNVRAPLGYRSQLVRQSGHESLANSRTDACSCFSEQRISEVIRSSAWANRHALFCCSSAV
jgi:hypothetical protein